MDTDPVTLLDDWKKFHSYLDLQTGTQVHFFKVKRAGERERFTPLLAELCSETGREFHLLDSRSVHELLTQIHELGNAADNPRPGPCILIHIPDDEMDAAFLIQRLNEHRDQIFRKTMSVFCFLTVGEFQRRMIWLAPDLWSLRTWNWDLSGSPLVAGPEPLLNPFKPWKPVYGPDFFGREVLLLELERCLESGQSAALVGFPKTGKTSLLHHWRLKATNLGRTVVLVDGSTRTAENPGILVGWITGHPSSGSPDHAANQLQDWAKTRQDRGAPALLLLDEAEGLLTRLPARFFERLRGMLDVLTLVLAGRRDPDLYYHDDGLTSPFYNQLRILRPGLLEPTAAEALLRLDPELDQQTRDLMTKWAGTHPFFLQLLGYHLWEARTLGLDRKAAMERFQADAEPQLRQIWNQLTARDQAAFELVLAKTKEPGSRFCGLLDTAGKPFGKVLTWWLEEWS